MSEATAALYGALIGVFGALLGVVVGLVTEYRLRRRGEVVREVRAWTRGHAPINIGGHDIEIREFEVRFFNDRDVNISLWDARVECYRGNELTCSVTPTRGGESMETVGPIDLESRKSVYVAMKLEVAVADEAGKLARLRNADRLKFVATQIPGEKKVCEPLPAWDPLRPT
jgi:hypothetical protein